jgi:hypothetical protein
VKNWEKPIKGTYPKFPDTSLFPLMIYISYTYQRSRSWRSDLRCTEHSGPPLTILLLMGGGGGPESVITLAQIWTAQGRALKSTVHNGFRTPPSVLPLMEGGGGPE